MPASLSSFARRSCKRLECALRTAPGLWRIGPNVLDPQLLERPPDLGRMTAIDFAACFWRVKVMRPAIGVEAHRQAVLGEDLLQRPEGRGGSLLLDEKGRIDRPRRIVHRDNQVERRFALEPGVPRAVLMQHHPRQAAAARASSDAPPCAAPWARPPPTADAA